MFYPGRAFFRRLVDLTKSVLLPHHRIRITEACRRDLQVWLQFLRDFNGRTFVFLDEPWQVSPPLKLYTDAAASKGYGALFGTRWFYGEWPAHWKSLNIAFLELFPITISLHVWGCQMSNQCVSLFTDNAVLVDIINKQTSKHPMIMILVRDLVLTSLRHNILFRAYYVPGVENSRADLISRLQIVEISGKLSQMPTQSQLMCPRPFSRRSGRYVKRITTFLIVGAVSQTILTCLGCLY